MTAARSGLNLKARNQPDKIKRLECQTTFEAFLFFQV